MLNVPTNCDIYDTEFSPHKWFVNFVKEDVHKELLEHWPNTKLFQDEGNEKPRKHGQRNHIRKFMCYANYTPNKMLQKFMIDTKNIPEVWQQFVEYIMTDKEYDAFLKHTLQINDYKLRLDWHLTQSGLDVSPHTDSNTKYGSHLFYFMPKGWNEMMGGNTVFYKDKQIEAMNPEPKDFAEQRAYSVMGNTSLLFKNTPDGWHGVVQVDSHLNRQIFNVVVLK